MNDRKHLHPELLWSLEYERGSWVKHHPLLTPRASAVMKALEAAEDGECHGCECESCEGCSSAWMLADDVMRAWRTP